MRAEGQLAIGTMVGTSLDGIDVALVELRQESGMDRATCVARTTVDFRSVDPARVRSIASGAATTASELSELGFLLARDHAMAVRSLLRESGRGVADIAFVAAHGVTLAHEPARAHGWQCLSGAALAAELGCDVIDDFRSGDIALGGQGAPLAPLADFALRRAVDEDRVILNLGGIANLTALPAGVDSMEHVQACDVGPANMPLDALVRRADPDGRGFDEDGRLAARGQVDDVVLGELLSAPWLRAPLPRSFGREQFGDAWLDSFWARTKGSALEDRLATLVEFEACAVRLCVDEVLGAWRRGTDRPLHLLVTGGGRRNLAMMGALERRLPHANVETIEAIGVDGDAKEAIDFAWLGWQRSRGEACGVHHVTGARRSVVLGAIHSGRGEAC